MLVGEVGNHVIMDCRFYYLIHYLLRRIMMTSYLRRKRIPTRDTNLGPPRTRWRDSFALWVSALFVLTFLFCQNTAMAEGLERAPGFIINDYHSNLAWMPDVKNNVNWHEAKDYCANLQKGKYSDWYMPYVKQIETLRYHSDLSLLSGTSYEHWTQDIVPEIWNGKHWWDNAKVFIFDGTIKELKLSNSGRYLVVRCVRNGVVEIPNQPPQAPRIQNVPSTAQTGSSIQVTVYGGTDPNGHKVRVKCHATNSNRSVNNPFVSGYSSPTSTTASFTFNSAGSQEIWCITEDEKQLPSDPTVVSLLVMVPPPPKPSETIPPNITISSPATNPFVTADESINITGNASDNSGIARIIWQTNRGYNGQASGTTSWNQKGIILENGENIITVTVYDTAGNSRSITLTVIKTISPSGNHRPSLEIVDAPLNAIPGQTYTVKLRATDPDNNLKEIQVDWSGRGDVETKTVSSTGGTVTFRHTYPRETSTTWVAVANDWLDAPSNKIRKWIPVKAVSFASKNTGYHATAEEIIGRTYPEEICCEQNLIGDPIDTATGAQTLKRTLLTVQGVLPISFTLKYHSLLFKEGPVGRSWSIDHFETHLEELPNGGVIVHWSANRFNPFTKNENGQYSSSDLATLFDKLVKNDDGSFTLSRKNKTIYEFDNTGLLVALSNPKGQTLTFKHDNTGKLTQVTEPVSGVFLKYAYNNKDLLETVTDSLNRQVRLGYDNDYNLTSITDAAGKTTTYSYNSLGQTLTATNADGVLLFRNTYDAEGRIIAQDDSVNGNQVFRFSYDENTQPGKIITTVTTRNGNTRIYTYDDDYQLLSLKDESGKTVRYGYTNGKRASTTNANGQTTRFTYDSRGNLIRIVNSGNNTSELSYDGNNNLISSKNALGEITLFAYDGNNNLISKTNPLGKITRYTYNSSGQMLTMTNPLGKRTTYQYQRGRVVSVTNPNGNRQTLAYDAVGRVIKVTAPNGDITTLTYDAVDRIVAITDPLNRTTRMTYDSRDNLLTLTDANGNITRNSYDGNGNLISRTDALSKSTRYEYDGEDQLIKVIDTNNGITQLSYDAKGRLISTTNPLGSTRTTTYDANDLPLTITDEEGHTKTFKYDNLGNVVRVINADGLGIYIFYDDLSRPVTIADVLHRRIRMVYDKNGNLLTITDFNGNATHRTYDDNDNLISQTDALGNQTRYEYDDNDQLVKVIDANNHATELRYDFKGRLTRITDALGRTRKLAYDKADNLLQQFDALGKAVKTITYDKVDNPLTVTDATNKGISFAYDKLNRLTRTTDPLNRVTEFQYDSLNRLVASIDALQGKSAQSFDANSNRTQLSDPNNQQTQFSFDKSGRLVTETLASGSQLTYRYNAKDLLTEMTNARGQKRQFEYDYVGRLTQFTDLHGTVSYTYDRNDNVLTVTESQIPPNPPLSKEGITREYDKLNRVVEYTDSQGNILQYAYNAVGNLVTLTYPNGKAARYEYDAVNQLTKVTDWAERVTGYSYDTNGRLIKVERPNGTNMARIYNAAGQLVQQKDVANNGEIISQFDFSYDVAGNITEEKFTPTPEQFPLPSVLMTYSTANRLDTYSGKTVPYDADGNMKKIPLADTLTAASFDSRNRLTQVGNTAYGYDAENQRIAVDTTRYVINPQAVLSQTLVKTAPDGTPTYYVYGLGLIGEETNGAYQTYHYDLRGSTVALTDASGVVVDRFQYSAFAQLVNHEGSSDTPFLYNGRDGVMTDANGLYYMRARFYNPNVRRFVNQDVLLGSIANGQSLNRYAFVTGNPVSFVDPFGLFGVPQWMSDSANWVADTTVQAAQAVGQFSSEIVEGYDPRNLVMATSIVYRTVMDEPIAAEEHKAMKEVGIKNDIACHNAMQVLEVVEYAGGGLISASKNVIKKQLTKNFPPMNKIKGHMGEIKSSVDALLDNKTIIGRQVSVKGNVGNKKVWVKIDQVERDIDTGEISFGEAKFNKANLTPNQRKLFPEIQKGGICYFCGNNAKKAGLPINTPMPATNVQIYHYYK
jgi:RHS repeat-associated protein